MSNSLDRRRFLQNSGLGFGSVAASWMMARDARAAEDARAAAKPPHMPATAKSIISLFMHGGPSHIDTFDPKPALEKLEGQRVPDSFGDVRLQFSTFKEQPILASRRKFQRHGQSGVVISDIEPGSAAEEAGLEPGDVILEAAGKKVDSPAAVAAASRDAAKGKGLLLKVKNQAGTRFVVVKAPH